MSNGLFSKGGNTCTFGEKGNNQSTQEQICNNFRVVIRVRPPLPRELHPQVPFQSSVLNIISFVTHA